MKRIDCHPEVKSVIKETVSVLEDIDTQINQLYSKKDELVLEMYNEILLVHKDEINGKPIFIHPSGEWFMINEL